MISAEIFKKIHSSWTAALFKLGSRNINAIAFLAYILAGVVLAATWYKYQLNPDATSYISIAQKYANFDIKDAINGYWGPLFSWFLVPLLWLDIDPVIASKIINVFATAGILAVLYLALRRILKIDYLLAFLLTAGSAPVLLEWALVGPVTPDLLFAFILMVELCVFVWFFAKPSLLPAIVLALCGALLYYTKSIGLLIFVVQLAVMTLYKIKQGNDLKFYTLHSIKVLLIFALLVSPFIGLLSFKYQQPMFSSTSTYNFGIIPPSSGGNLQHPVNFSGPFPPPNINAFSAWEDPTNLPTTKWSPLSSADNFTYYISLIWSNLSVARDALISFGPIIALGFLLLVTSVFHRRSKDSDFIFMAAVSAGIIVLAYCLIFIENRYLWGVGIISLFGVAYFIRNNIKRTAHFSLVAALLVVISFWIGAQSINTHAYAGQNLEQESSALQKIIPANSNVISDSFTSIYTCYYLDLRCFSVLSPPGNKKADNELASTLDNLGIAYFIDYKTTENSPALNKFLKVHAEPIRTVGDTKIYSFSL